MIIYKITNLINGKIYIGQDSKNDDTYYGSGLIIKRAINKYGKENFNKELIEICNSKEELNKKEIFWISEFNSTNSDIGYNLSIGGNGGNLGEYVNKKISEKSKLRVVSDETKKKLSILNKGEKNAFYGKHHSEETKKHLSEQKIGFKHTTESKLKISKATKGENNPFYGKYHSDELKNRFRKMYGNKVIVKYKNGDVNKYNSVREASEKENISRFFIKKSSKLDVFISDKKFKII